MTNAETIPITTVTGVAKIGGETVNLTYRTPTHAKDLRDPVPLKINHGWGGPELAYGPLAEAVAQNGKPSITSGEGRTLGILGDLNPLHLLRVSKLTSKAAWAAIRYVRDEFDQDIFDVYGHSLGGQTAVNIAMHKPEHVRSVILDGSTGLDLHSLPEMIHRTGRFAKGELIPSFGDIVRSTVPETGKQFLHYVGRHPARTLAEGIDAGHTNLHERLAHLADMGIYAAALQSQNDLYFPVSDVIRDSAHLFGHVHVRTDPKSNHFAPQLDPLGTANAITESLAQLATFRNDSPPIHAAA